MGDHGHLDQFPSTNTTRFAVVQAIFFVTIVRILHLILLLIFASLLKA